MKNLETKNMKSKKLGWLLLATLLIFLLPLLAEKYSPETFGKAYIQWTSAVVAAPMLSIGLFLSIQTFYSRPEERNMAGWTSLGFIAFFCFVVGLYGVAGPLIARTQHVLETSDPRLHIPSLLSDMQEAETELHRKVIARSIYTLGGVAIPYQTDSGTYTVYSPTEEEVKFWTGTRELEVKKRHIINLLDSQLKQLPWLASLYVGSLFLTFALGLPILAKKKSKQTPNPPSSS